MAWACAPFAWPREVNPGLWAPRSKAKRPGAWHIAWACGLFACQGRSIMACWRQGPRPSAQAPRNKAWAWAALTPREVNFALCGTNDLGKAPRWWAQCLGRVGCFEAKGGESCPVWHQRARPSAQVMGTMPWACGLFPCQGRHQQAKPSQHVLGTRLALVGCFHAMGGTNKLRQAHGYFSTKRY